MEERRYGTNPMKENQYEACASINRSKRYAEIKSVLEGHKMTFREIALEMYKRGYTIGPETTYSQPRVTELVQKGEIEPVGKVKSELTGKTVTVFALRNV